MTIHRLVPEGHLERPGAASLNVLICLAAGQGLRAAHRVLPADAGLPRRPGRPRFAPAGTKPDPAAHVEAALLRGPGALDHGVELVPRSQVCPPRSGTRRLRPLPGAAQPEQRPGQPAGHAPGSPSRGDRRRGPGPLPLVTVPPWRQFSRYVSRRADAVVCSVEMGRKAASPWGVTRPSARSSRRGGRHPVHAEGRRQSCRPGPALRRGAPPRQGNPRHHGGGSAGPHARAGPAPRHRRRRAPPRHRDRRGRRVTLH